MSSRSTSKLTVVSPFNQATVAEVPWDTPAIVDSKLNQARKANELWKDQPLEARIGELATGLKSFRGEGEKIARDISLQMGKPIVQARKEVDTMLARAEHLMVIAKYALAPDVMPAQKGMKLRIEHHPIGVVLDIAAWNYPLLVPVNVVIPALLAGNSVLLKHSPITPLCGQHFERHFGLLSIPHLVQNVVIQNERAEELIEDPRIDYVAFTGSIATGRKVFLAAARRGIGAGLEMGGKDPAYVAEDADVEFAAVNVVDGACFNAGQSCCAVERAYVHQGVYEAFLERARTEMRQYRMGDPLDERTNLGPLARREAGNPKFDTRAAAT
jgi:acyl-CoA reductase-like NAD-dependent aldehyde dehydrogenase